MKKLKYILAVFLAAFILAPSTMATGATSQYAVEIISVDREDISGDAVETAAPDVAGLEMTFSTSFTSLSDSIKYKVTIKNNTDTEYLLSEETPFSDSDYITFAYDLDDTLLEGNGEAVVHVTLTYTYVAPANYTATNRAVIKLTDKQGNTVNPNTSDASRSFLLILAACAAIALAFVMLFSRRRRFAWRGIFGLVLAICVIPLVASAIETLSLTVNVNIAITEKKYAVSYIGGGQSDYYKVSDYSFLSSDCGDYTVYVGEQTADNEYRFCKYPIYESGSYAAGERVNLEEVTFNYIELNNTDECTIIDDYSAICPESQIIRKSYDPDVWSYNTRIGERYGITYNPDDKDVMSFDDAFSDHWADSGYLYLSSPNAFTMPAHDVVFEYLTK